jgi:hypothetical protein
LHGKEDAKQSFNTQPEIKEFRRKTVTWLTAAGTALQPFVAGQGAIRFGLIE